MTNKVTKKATVNVKKSITVRVLATKDVVTVRYPNQSLGTVALIFDKQDGSQTILKQWELELSGETLRAKVVK